MVVWIVHSWEPYGCAKIERIFAKKRDALQFAYLLRYFYATEEYDTNRRYGRFTDPHDHARRVEATEWVVD